MKLFLGALVALLVVSFASAAWWLADHARPRHDEFVERRGAHHGVELEEISHEAGGFTSQGVRLTADSGLRFYASVLRPAAEHEPLPVVVLLGGYRTGRDAVRLVGHPGNAVMVALDYPYDGPMEIRSATSFARSTSAIQQALLDTPPATSVLLDWLSTQPWADVSQAELVGVSFGAPFVAVAGALDERFRRVWIIHGGAGNRDWIEHNLQVHVPQAWLRPFAAAMIHLLIYGASFDTEDWVAQIAPRPVVIIGAREDERVPEHMVKNLYRAAKPPKELIWTEGGHVDPRRPDLVQALLDIVRDRIVKSPPESRRVEMAVGEST
jgi:dienelactone hydrolase